MADEYQLSLLKQGAEVWNRWRETNKETKIDLSHANLSEVDLCGFNFSGANLYSCSFGPRISSMSLGKGEFGLTDFTDANLSMANFWGSDARGCYFYKTNLFKTNFYKANLYGNRFDRSDITEAILSSTDSRRTRFGRCNLNKADFEAANLFGADFRYANLSGANLGATILSRANFESADLTDADLSSAILNQTNLNNAIIKNCLIYGLSAWDLKGIPSEESTLTITPYGEPKITVDNLSVAQFVYLLLNRQNLRDVFDTLATKTVLILGRFTFERKVILDALADELRRYNLIPIIFDFERPPSRDFAETLKTLAGLSFFIIADITNPKSSPLELQATIPDYQIPFIPIIQEGEEPFAMFSDLLGKYDWVLNLVTYKSKEQVIKGFKSAILDRAWEKHKELQARKTVIIQTRTIDDFMSKNLS